MDIRRGLHAFYALQLFAFAGSIILVVTAAWSPLVKRQPAWFSLMVSTMIATASYSLLLFFGYKTDPRPPFGLCVTQAALGYAIPVLMTGTTLTLVVTALISIRAQISGSEIFQRKRGTVLFIGFPYVLQGIIFIYSLIVGLTNPNTVVRGAGWYCTFIVRTPARITSAIVVLLAAIVLLFQGAIVWHLRGHWRQIRSNTIRIGIFFVACFLVVIVATIIPNTSEQNINIAVACLPVVAVLIFGVSKDIGRAWMFWRKFPPPVDPAPEARSDDSLGGKMEHSQV